jgi:hypothetical protein
MIAEGCAAETGEEALGKTMRKLLIAGVLFVLMALWTWYNY